MKVLKNLLWGWDGQFQRIVVDSKYSLIKWKFHPKPYQVVLTENLKNDFYVHHTAMSKYLDLDDALSLINKLNKVKA